MKRGFWARFKRWLHIGIRPTAEIEIRRLQEEQAEIRRAVMLAQRQAALADPSPRRKRV